MKLLIALLLATQAVSQELNSTLYSTLYGIQVAFVDEMIVFTCVVGGSSMAWTSDEYIGEGQQLIILSVDPPGVLTSAVDNPQTVAELVSATSSGIVTQLRIRVASTFPIASVQCQDSTANTMISTTFQLAGGVLITCDRVTVCPGETVTCACATGNSNSLTWVTDGNRVQFSSSDPLLTRENVGSSTSAVLTENSDRNGVRVIMSNITVGISMSSTDPLVTLTCENDGAMVQPILLPISAFPEAPQGISAAEISQSLDDICIILVTWDPPANSDLSDIDQYNIVVNVTSQNITADSTSSCVHFLHVPNCRDVGGVRIQVAAVNRFGCEGSNVEVQASLLHTTAEGGSASTSKASLMTPTTGTATLIPVFSSIIIIMCAISSIVFLSIGCACGWFGHKHKQSRTRKATSDSAGENNLRHIVGSEHSQTPGPLYEELQQRSTSDHQDMVELNENVAYGPTAAKENNLRHIEGSEHSQTPGSLYEELEQRSTSEHQDVVELNENVAYGPNVDHQDLVELKENVAYGPIAA